MYKYVCILESKCLHIRISLSVSVKNPLGLECNCVELIDQLMENEYLNNVVFQTRQMTYLSTYLGLYMFSSVFCSFEYIAHLLLN